MLALCCSGALLYPLSHFNAEELLGGCPCDGSTVPRFHVFQTPSTVEIREVSHLATLSLTHVAAVFIPITTQDPRLLGVIESRPVLYSEPGSQSSGWKRELRKWALLSPALVSHVG